MLADRFIRSALLVGSVLLAVSFFVAAPHIVRAQTTSPGNLSSTIRAQLLSDPRTSALSQQQLDSMVQMLVQAAQERGLTSADLTWRPQQLSPAASQTATAATCATLSCIADEAYGFIGPDVGIAYLLGIASMGLIWIIAETLHRHKYPHASNAVVAQTSAK